MKNSSSNQHVHDKIHGNKKRKQKRSKKSINSHGEKRYFIAEGSETIRVMIQNCSTSRDPTWNTTKERKGSTTTHHDDNADCIRRNPIPVHIISILVKPSIFFEEPTNLLSTLHKLYPSTNQISDESNNEKKNAKSNDPLLSISITPPFQIIVSSEETISELIGE